MLDEGAESRPDLDEVGTIWRLATALAGAATPMEVAAALAREGGAAAEGVFANLAYVVDGASTDVVRVVHRLPVGPTGTVRSMELELDADRPACEAIRTDRPVLLGSLDEVRRRFPAILAELEDAGLVARASIPLHQSDGEVIGSAGFGWASPQEFPASQLRHLQLIAQLAGLALERSLAQARADHLAPGEPRGIENMPSPFFSLDHELSFTYMNAEGERVLHATRADLLGRSLLDAFPEASGSMFEVKYREAIDTGRPVTFEAYYAPLESWFEVHAWPDQRGLNVAFWNIDERLATERERTLALNEAQRERTRLSYLSEVSARLTGATTRQEVLERLARVVVPTAADWCTIVVPEGDCLVRVAAAHRDVVLDDLARRLVGAYPHPFSGPSPAVPVYRSGRPMRLARLAQQIVADLDDSAASAAYGRTLMLLGDGPGLIMPLHLRDQVVAVITMIRAGGEPYLDDDVQLMTEVAARVATALEHAERVESQRATAAALQEAALPKTLPVTASLSLAAGYRAASEGTQVGGDWYDAFVVRNGHVVLVVGDAAGHGLEAAAVMTQMRNALRAYLFESLGPAQSIASLRRLMETQAPDSFATIVCVEIDPEDGSVRWASAGHLAPVRVSGAGTSAHLRGRTAPPIGWTSTRTPSEEHEQHLVLSAGDRLILFTDGLVERRDADIDVGLTHLQILAEKAHGTTSPAGACEEMLHDMLGGSHEDDVCLLVAEFKPG